ncbi:MAG TPA: hypothetical protein VHK47_14490 [Polyangia bacterium]|jgi:hypothetical protein|nr:hypothetical protein [Polyangia bacterium]
MNIRLAVAALLALTLGSATARAERPRIAIMELGGAKATPDLRERMTRSVHEGLLASGADVVDGMPVAATGPGGAPCQGNGCVTAVAKATVAAYVVRGTLEVDGRTYELRLEMLDGKTGDLLESREDRCEICTEGEALEMAGVSASALKVQTFKKRAGGGDAVAVGVAVPLPPAKTVIVAAPPGSGVAEGSMHAGPNGVSDEAHRELGWIGVGVGLFAGFVGGELIAHDGDPTCSGGFVDTDPMHRQCAHAYSTTGWGVASIVGGALAVAAGVLVLTGKF